MNLMISFILRYATVLIKDRVIQAHYDPNRFDDLSMSEMKLFCDDFGGVSGFMVMIYATFYFSHLLRILHRQTLLLRKQSWIFGNKYASISLKADYHYFDSN